MSKSVVLGCLFVGLGLVGCVPSGEDGGGDECPEGQSLNPVSGDCEEPSNNATNNATNNGANNETNNATNNDANNVTNNAGGEECMVSLDVESLCSPLECGATTFVDACGQTQPFDCEEYDSFTPGCADGQNCVDNTCVGGDDGTNNQTNNAGGDTGSLFGVVTRSASPAAGGVGGLYIGVFDGNPLAGGELVANARIEGVDMTSADAAVAYRIDGVTVRAQEYSVIAFLDDNGTVDPNDEDSQAPDMGDLVSLDGFGAPTVTVDVSGDVEFDIDLNVNMPF